MHAFKNDYFISNLFFLHVPNVTQFWSFGNNIVFVKLIHLRTSVTRMRVDLQKNLLEYKI